MFAVTANSVDANWNLISTNDTAKFTSTDASAVLPANTPLVAGTLTADLTFMTAGSATITLSNLTHTTITNNTSPSITINKGNQTISFGALASKNYGDAPFAVAATASSGLAVSFSIVSGPATVSGNNVTITGAGTVTVRAAQVGNANWNAAPNVDQSFTVNPAALAVTANNAGRAYGAANPAFTPSYSGFVNGDNAGVLTGTPSLTTTATAGSPIGAYVITAAQGSLSAANYTFTFVDGTLTISKAPLTVTADNKSRAYGAANPTLTGNIVGIQNSDNITASYSTSADASSLVGPYSIVPSLNDPDGKLGNYTVTLNNGTLSVTPAALSVTADDKSRVYAGANPTLTGSITGIQNGDNITASYSTTATVSSPVGNYNIVPSLNDPDSKLGNYTVTTNNGTLSVTPAALTVTADDKSRVYGAANPAFTGNIVGIQNSDNITASYTTTADVSSSVGAYSIVPSFNDPDSKLGNYTVTTNNGTLTISAAELMVGADDTSRAYGSLNVLTASYFGFVNGETTNVLSGAPLLSTIADTNSPTGDYPITISVGTLSNANYSFIFTNGTLTITQAALTVTADNQTRVYGAANPALTVSYSGFVNGQDANILSGTPDVSTSADASTGVGTYPIVPSQGTLSASDTNYSLAYVNGTLTITPAALSVTADDQSRLYGAANPTLTGNIVGIQNSDNITASYSTSADPTSAVGPYSIVPSLNDPDSKLTNYNVTINNGTLTVDPAPLSVTADNKSRTYGAANPAFTGSIVGIQNGDNITATYSTTATASSPVGSYGIVPSLQDPDTKLGNYAVTSNNGTLTVNPANLLGYCRRQEPRLWPDQSCFHRDLQRLRQRRKQQHCDWHARHQHFG